MEVKYNRFLAMYVYILFLCLALMKSHLCDGASFISVNQSLFGDQTIESPRGVFVLGFFKPGNFSNYYIGMWYKDITPQTIVWVANRDKPVSNRLLSELRISNGNLVLFDENKVPIWSTGVNQTATSSPLTRVMLNDIGNLVLTDGADPPKTLWQSFDNPSHTWLPGAKISYNNVTKTHQRLTSWKNSEDPSPGLYTLELDPSDNSYIILWNRTIRYWTSGPWNGEIFSKVPEMRRNYIYDFDFVVTSNESYFTYTVYPNAVIKISRFAIDISGQVKQTNWLGAAGWSLFWSQPRQQCEVYAYCGAFGSCAEKSLPFCRCLTGFEPRAQRNWDLGDFSDGCSRRTRLSCGGGEPDGFLELHGVLLPENKQSSTTDSESDCRSGCLRDCGCTAYAFEDDQCSVWTEDLLNLKQLVAGDGNGKTLFVRLAASDVPSSKHGNKAIVAGAVAGSAIVILIVVGVVLFLFWKRKAVVRGKAMEGSSLVSFGYRELQSATKNFSERLGGGGFGSVFKGTLSDSTVIAVKKLESVSQGEKQFRTEVATIGTIQHLNLVRLRGFCSDGTHKLLVYDYMPNGSLDSHLFSTGSSKALLDWDARYRIAVGTARGLVYLHEKCRDCIIHCDIKPENVLLDAELVPKVADFGLAKLVGRDFSRVLTTMRGTRGYLAPEWIAGVAITAKADTYSYGMMLFELVSGRRNSDDHHPDGRVRFFPTWAAGVVSGGGDALSLLDPRLETGGDGVEKEVERTLRVACWCVQDEESNRPTMSQVVQILEGIAEVNVPPIPRSLQVFGDGGGDDVVFFTELSSSSSQTSNARSNVSSKTGRSVSSTSSRT